MANKAKDDVQRIDRSAVLGAYIYKLNTPTQRQKNSFKRMVRTWSAEDLQNLAV